MEALVRGLLNQEAESRGLDYKGPMSWAGPKAVRVELVRDLMCFSNTPGGGNILVGVAEQPDAWLRVGLSVEQARTFEISKIGDLAAQFCSGLPIFRVQTLIHTSRSAA